MRRPITLVSVCAAGVLALAGCGSGSQADPEATSVASPSVDRDGELVSCLVGSWDFDASFLQSTLEAGMADPTIAFSDIAFTATQTQTLDEDKTFTAELEVEMTMTGTAYGQAIPMSVSGTGSASGTWKVDDGEVMVTVDERDGVGTMSGGGRTIDLPNASSLGKMMLLPTELYPVTCTDDTMTIEVEGMSDVLVGAPDKLVATRQ